MLKASGLPEIRTADWYPVRSYLSFLKRVDSVYGAKALRAMGQAIPDTSKFPPDMDTPARALQMLDVAYQVNHRGGAIGRYRCTELLPGRAVMICENPYPCDLDLGILERLLALFAPIGLQGTVAHVHGKHCRRQGGRACHLELRWWHAEP